jgi:uncharacterized cupin superfamily protein
VPEATLRETETGLALESEGWFVINVADARWRRHVGAGVYTVLESDAHGFPDFGIGIHVVDPGEPNALYHSESNQEAFLVLSGECILIVEEQERRLRAWDFFHCPPGTRHIIVGAGDGPCAILMVGARDPDAEIVYPVSEVAERHGASVKEETRSPREAYAAWDRGHGETDQRLPWPLPDSRA